MRSQLAAWATEGAPNRSLDYGRDPANAAAEDWVAFPVVENISRRLVVR